MKKYLLAALIMVLPVAGMSGNIEYLQNMAQTKQVTMADAVKMFAMEIDKSDSSFEKEVSSLIKAKILPDKKYNAEKPLRRGDLALMSARYLKLSDSIWYTIFGSRRYAYTACISAKIMTADGSEYDYISGPQLLETMRIISEKAGDKNAK